MSRLILATLASFLLGNPASAQLVGVRLDYVTVQEGPSQSGDIVRTVGNKTIYVSADGRERTEISRQGSGTVSIAITDPLAGVVYQLFPEKKMALRTPIDTVKEKARIAGQNAPESVKGKHETLGVRMIQGFTCQGHRTEMTHVGQFANSERNGFVEFWQCRDPGSGTTITGALYVELPNGAWRREELRQVQRSYPLDPGLFEVPGDFRIIEK